MLSLPQTSHPGSGVLAGQARGAWLICLKIRGARVSRCGQLASCLSQQTRQRLAGEGGSQLPQPGPGLKQGVQRRTSVGQPHKGGEASPGVNRTPEDRWLRRRPEGPRALVLAQPADVLCHQGPPDTLGGGAMLFRRRGSSGASHSLPHSHANRCQPSRR